jgi:hypothetical protein
MLTTRKQARKQALIERRDELVSTIQELLARHRELVGDLESAEIDLKFDEERELNYSSVASLINIYDEQPRRMGLDHGVRDALDRQRLVLTSFLECEVASRNNPGKDGSDFGAKLEELDWELFDRWFDTACAVLDSAESALREEREAQAQAIAQYAFQRYFGPEEEPVEHRDARLSARRTMEEYSRRFVDTLGLPARPGD